MKGGREGRGIRKDERRRKMEREGKREGGEQRAKNGMGTRKWFVGQGRR